MCTRICFDSFVSKSSQMPKYVNTSQNSSIHIFCRIELYCIEKAKCQRPRRGPRFTKCYSHNVVLSFDRKGLTQCGQNYFLAGFYKSSWYALDFPFLFLPMWVLCSEKIYCLEYFWCCTNGCKCIYLAFWNIETLFMKFKLAICKKNFLIPQTRWEYQPRKQNWWNCFNRKNWCGVPSHTWITGFWRNSCSDLLCIEEAYRSRPVHNQMTNHVTLNQFGSKRFFLWSFNFKISFWQEKWGKEKWEKLL